MARHPTVSAIIPAYNADSTLADSIESVLSQTYSNFELIIVDDLSTDNTCSIVSQFEDSRIKLVKHDVNHGASVARNTGIENAIGKYVAFLDADDIWLAEKLEEQLQFIQRQSSNKVKMSCTSFTMVRAGGERYERDLDPDLNWSFEILEGCTTGPGSTMMVERSVFFERDVGMYRKDLLRLEDWDWMLRYSYKYKIGILDKVLSVVHVTGYPKYSTVQGASEKLKQLQGSYIQRNYGLKGFASFISGIEIENAAAAFRTKKYLMSVIHLFRAGVRSPGRVVRLFYRILVKIFSRDYSTGTLKQKN